MTHLKITAVIHGSVDKYIRHVESADFSIQLGDFSTEAGAYQKFAQACSPARHKFLGGNHENYSEYDESLSALGHFGARSLGNIAFYFIRGAYSLNYNNLLSQQLETGLQKYWIEEQLSFDGLEAAVEDYTNSQPQLMLSHTCPDEVAKLCGFPSMLRKFRRDPDTFTTNTQLALQKCFDQWQPKVWVFGHFHTNWAQKVNNTLFICLDDHRKSLNIDIEGWCSFKGYRFNLYTGEVYEPSV